MNIEEIRAQAPKGATHYIEANDKVFYVMKKMIWFRNTWCFAAFKDDVKLKPLH